MKRIKVTFRLTPDQLARGLQTVRQLEPSYKLISINDLVKTIYHNYLAKMTMNKLDEIPISILTEIMHFADKPSQKQMTLKDLMNISQPKELPKQIEETKTESEISSVTDFSPPKEWLE